ncbi:TRAP transporter large permease [Granulosicoccus antarcticus]|uniref:TRAP transporter large permease protein n=1 Tax=Granulosicoccus antarcticus IMCC3135 TaxID=1192854 RepID=A0A2Z2NND5_9GAMM|nr:TRAP transporter large permease subunit [Granulosicoccus antarcticus]ASJ72743.1 C4-dicarboxylate TRAP transporter large permease protein DctM [Granulosicoccus antarcticus IMCC3135]
MATLIFSILTLLLILVLLGVHIAVALGAASALGVYFLLGSPDIAFSVLSGTAYEALRKDIFIVIPLFVLMGGFVSHSGAAKDIYTISNRAFRKIPGCLAVATVSGNSIFAAITGVSIASAATFSRIAYPEMVALGYKKSYALGVIAGSACLGMLIPPSILMIIWAVLTEISIGALFIAGLLPGLLLATFFILYCIITAKMNPQVAPPCPIPTEENISPSQRRSELISGTAILGLIGIVIGGIWGGFLTPTEAAGFGAMGAFIVGLLKGMRRKEIIDAIYSAGKTTAPIMILLITASMYSRFLAMGGAVSVIHETMFAISEDPMVLIAMIFAIWLVLGMFIDSTSIILLTVPIFAPIATLLGVNELAFAIFGILVIEAGLLTPPFGLLIFTVKAAVPDQSVTLGMIFKGSIPYWIMILVVAILILAFPFLTTWLPQNLM